jgi:hypothetical protein
MTTILATLGSAVFAQSSMNETTALSAAETAAIERQIATLHSAAERKMANQWSDAKKVAETLCRPSALPVLKKQLAGVDRVFLGTDDPKTLNLASDRLLTGAGSARSPQGRRDFAFTCELDPDTGKVSSFQVAVKPEAK